MPKPSPVAYNLFALFFAFWGGIALYLLVGGDTAPEIRLTFAVCGVLTVYAATMGRWFKRVKITPAAFSVPTWARVMLIFLTLCAGGSWYMVNSVNAFYADSLVAFRMKDQFNALKTYAENHNGTLPPDMRSANVTRYLGIEFRIAQKKVRGEPFVWNDKLADKRFAALEQHESVVVVYSQKISERKQRVVIFLDGHKKHNVSPERLRELLSKSDRVIAAAKRTKPNAIEPANAVH